MRVGSVAAKSGRAHIALALKLQSFKESPDQAGCKRGVGTSRRRTLIAMMRTELPNEHVRWNDVLVKELSMLAVFAVIGVAARWNDMLVKLWMRVVFAVIGAAVVIGLVIAFSIWFRSVIGLTRISGIHAPC